MKTKRVPRVTFNEELNSVVPVIALPEKGHLKPVTCPMESEGSGDLRVRRGKRKREKMLGEWIREENCKLMSILNGFLVFDRSGLSVFVGN